MKAPSEQSTKRPVSRIRDIPGLKPKGSKSLYQDPRFDTALGKANLQRARKNYKFLDTYREDELANLRNELRNTKEEEERELIAKAIQSQKSRLETLRKRDEEDEILGKLRNKKISRAKKREIVLKERFNRMSSREVARTLEKRRRKVAQKQKKLLPERRPQESD